MEEEIKKIRELGILEYLHQHIDTELADVVLTVFLDGILQRYTESDIDELEEMVIEDLEEFYGDEGE